MAKNSEKKPIKATEKLLGAPIRLSTKRGGGEGSVSRVNPDGTVSVKMDGNPARFEHRVVLGVEGEILPSRAAAPHSKSELRRLAIQKGGERKR